MRRTKTPQTRTAARLVRGLAALLILVLGGCQSDSPTAPTPTPAPVPPPSGPPPSAAWSVSVTVTPNPINLNADGSTVAATVSVFVRRADTGAVPPNNATIVLTTSAGTLSNSQGSVGVTIPVLLSNGQGQATLSFAGLEATTVIVQGSIEGSIGQAQVQFLAVADPDEEDPLFIESVSPITGPPSGGTKVTIRGTGFVGPVRVFFGANAALLDSFTETRIVVRTPPTDLPVGAIQTVAVQVDVGVNTEETATDTLSNAFTYTRGDVTPPVPPRILSVSPSSGPNEGGTQVTILGEGFATQVQVFFGTAALIEAAVLDTQPGRILVVSPAAIGTNAVNRDSLVDVRVVNRDSGAEAIRVGAFQYGSPTEQVIITSVAPTQGPYTGGTQVEILGQGFDEPVAVSLAQVAQQILSVTGTKVVIRTVAVDVDNCADVSGATSITNLETGVGATGPDFTFRVPEPSIFDVTPRTSVAGGGATFTITGVNFEAPIRVTFDFPGGPVTASGVTVNAAGTVITGTLPAFIGDFEEEDCNDNGDEQDGTRLIPTAVSLDIESLITTCTDDFENAILYSPPSSACVDDVAPPPPPPPPPPPVPEPTAAFHFVVNGCNVTFLNDSEDQTSNSWNFGHPAPNNTSTVEDPSHNFGTPGATGNGDYTVTLTVTNATGSDSDAQVVSIVACP